MAVRKGCQSRDVFKVNIGCGRDIREGWVNCDLFRGDGVDVVLDASKRLPFQSGSVQTIHMSHVMEHIINWEDLVYECHRVLAPGGTLEIVVPYGVTFNPFHVRFFMPETLDMFCVTHPKGDCMQFTFEQPLFSLKARQVLRGFWFGWHLDRYLHVRRLNGLRYEFFLGKKLEIRWLMEKNIDRKCESPGDPAPEQLPLASSQRSATGGAMAHTTAASP